ncbi:MAG: sigma 54-interacting transcriptional regulator [Syntrophorhabdales bacterium]
MGRNPKVLDIISFITRIAPYYKTTTMTGETVTGRELVARALHSLSSNKGLHEQFFSAWSYLSHPGGVTSQEATVTVFEPRGDKAYVAGFYLMKLKGEANALKWAMYFQQIINEHREWKWFGNQK